MKNYLTPAIFIIFFCIIVFADHKKEIEFKTQQVQKNFFDRKKIEKPEKSRKFELEIKNTENKINQTSKKKLKF